MNIFISNCNYLKNLAEEIRLDFCLELSRRSLVSLFIKYISGIKKNIIYYLVDSVYIFSGTSDYLILKFRTHSKKYVMRKVS